MKPTPKVTAVVFEIGAAVLHAVLGSPPRAIVEVIVTVTAPTNQFPLHLSQPDRQCELSPRARAPPPLT